MLPKSQRETEKTNQPANQKAILVTMNQSDENSSKKKKSDHPQELKLKYGFISLSSRFGPSLVDLLFREAEVPT